MSKSKVIPVSNQLWIVIEEGKLTFSGLFELHDSTNSDVLIDTKELPELIRVLTEIQKQYATTEDK